MVGFLHLGSGGESMGQCLCGHCLGWQLFSVVVGLIPASDSIKDSIIAVGKD